VTDIGVLLPLRLETRFDKRGTAWWLRLRVIPDEPWYDRREQAPSTAEVASLEHFAATAGPPAQPAAQTAWRTLAAEHGPAHAWWLLRSQLTWNGITWQVRPSTPRTKPGFPAVLGFPPRIQVWLARGGAAPAVVADLTVKVGKLTLELPETPQQPRWWLSWPEAVDVGLATEIPLGPQADDIDVLYVVGIGDEDPAKLLGAHTDAGRLMLLAPGTPTNTVDGGRTADADPDQWWAAYLRGTASAATGRAAEGLTGRTDALPALPNEPPANPWQHVMTALWPALFGHTLRDLAGFGQQAYQLGDALATGLAPEGPYPALRIGNQPYGVLPVTALAAWKPGPGEPKVLAELAGTLQKMRDAWSAAAQGRGTVAGADAARLADLIAQPPRSPGFAYRSFLPLELFALTLHFIGVDANLDDLTLAWDTAGQAPGVKLRTDQPVRRYASRDFAHPLGIPLIDPPGGDDIRTLLKRLTEAVTDPAVLASDQKIADALGCPPHSLLLAMVIWSLRLAAAAMGQPAAEQSKDGPVLIEPVAVPATTTSALARYIASLTASNLTKAEEFQKIRKAVTALADTPADELARLLAGAVDTACYRLDAWLTALPAQRLYRLMPARTPGTRWRLGAYGWVDAPRPGQPGPTGGGLLHAPSESQAITAAILRDRALTDPETDRWAMSVTSDRVRRAAALADQVRTGAHPREALGRAVERVVGAPVAIESLRRRFPLRSEQNGRRTCDGMAVLAADPAGLGLSAAARAGLDKLRAAVDVYGDLLVADAVYQMVEGRAATAGASLDAAAGLGRPPNLDVLRTHREGRAVTSTALFLLPDAAPPLAIGLGFGGTELSPATVADPAVASWLTDQLGKAEHWGFTAHGSTAGITIEDLDLAPADALVLAEADLRRLALAQLVAVDPAATAPVGGSGIQRHRRGLRALAALGTAATEVNGARADTGSLADRLHDLHDIGKALAEKLADGDTDAVRAATRWGIVAPDGVDAAAHAAGVLSARLGALPDVDAVIESGPDETVRAIRALVAPEGVVGVLGRMTRGQLPKLGLADAAGADWLATVAPVRPALARLDAYRLTAASPPRPWASRADVWQTQAEEPGSLVMAYLPDGYDPTDLDDDDIVAVSRIDNFSEVIPAAQQATHAAFGFDGPAARAPQAVLLAVPPDVGGALDAAGLVGIVADARLLARVRMATPADLKAYRAVLPTVLLPAAGPFAVNLREKP
jgi:hypothetical protein